MERKNCWEFMQCGMEEGGVNAEKHGVCPASIGGLCDGVNNGRFAGRFCWAIQDTKCGCKKQGTKEEQLMNCINCKFLQKVNDDEGREFILMPPWVEFFK